MNGRAIDAIDPGSIRDTSTYSSAQPTGGDGSEAGDLGAGQRRVQSGQRSLLCCRA